jgi:hypothetical protein
MPQVAILAAARITSAGRTGGVGSVLPPHAADETPNAAAQTEIRFHVIDMDPPS